MGHPELNSDESVILDTQNVVVKSVPFEAILTTERLILQSSRDSLLPPRYIPLAAIKGMEPGENAIRDPVITLSVLTESGGPRPMVLTFSRSGGGDRRRECDEWIKILKDRIAIIRQKMAPAVASSSDVETSPRPEPVTPGQIGTTTGRPAKKKIEIARPIKKIAEVNAPPKPVETTSLPQGSFCGRCGNRVPPGSTFCNKCGTKVATPASESENPEPVIQQVAVPLPPVIAPGTEHRDRPIEQVIHSIEPLIEDSKPRTQPAPLVPSRYVHLPSTAVTPEVKAEAPVAVPAAPEPVSEPEAPVSDQTQKNLTMFSTIFAGKETSPAEPAPVVPETPRTPVPPAVAEPAPVSSVPQIAIPAPATPQVPSTPPAPAPATPQVPSTPPAPAPVMPPARKRSRFLPFAILIIAIIAIAGIAFVFVGHPGGTSFIPSIQPTTVPTTVPTTIPTTVPTTVATPVPTTTAPTPIPTPIPLAIPQNGVWVYVNYDGTFTGSYGTPGAQQGVTDSGEHIYNVPTSTGVVAASFTKNDGSAKMIVTKVYKDGSLVTTDSTTTPKGTAQIQFDLKSLVTPPPTSPEPSGTNATVSASP